MVRKEPFAELLANEAEHWGVPSAGAVWMLELMRPRVLPQRCLQKGPGIGVWTVLRTVWGKDSCDNSASQEPLRRAFAAPGNAWGWYSAAHHVGNGLMQ